MAIPQNNIIQVSYRGECLGQRILMLQNYRVLTSISGGNTVSASLDLIIAALAPTAAGSLGAKYLDCMAHNYQYLSCRAQVLYPTRSAFREVTAPAAGGMSEDAPATNLSYGVILRTDSAGRGQQCVKHIGPCPADSVTGGRPSGVIVGRLASLLGALAADVANVGGGSLRPIVYHRRGDGPAAKYTDITGGTVSDYVRTMRRRTLGVGE